MAEGIQMEGGSELSMGRSPEDVVQRPGGASDIDMLGELAPVNRNPVSPVQKGKGNSGIDMAGGDVPLSSTPMTPYGSPDDSATKPWPR
jgi:hypothetical protein